jgi:peptidoglycan/LPS O-acetylase OafA/YrhL
LRAIAVLAVVFHHAGLSCPGGFVGVDVFFVLSGFLISTLILHDLGKGQFSLGGFWERRMRRIAPSLGFMVLAILGTGFFLLLPGDYKMLGSSSIAQALMGANVFFMQRPGGYFADTEIQPLLHTWSLAVEEQFYLIFPLVLMLIFRNHFLSRPGALRFLLLALWTASLLLTLAKLNISSGDNRFIFYMLPARAWELLCGALLAVAPRKWSTAPRLLKGIVAWLGLVGILLPIWAFSKLDPFPGPLALPPCLGAMAFIWANTRTPTEEVGTIPTLAGRLLALRPFVLIGLVSYSLYLWHWPLFVFQQYGTPPAISAFVKLGMIALSGWLAVLSWRYVEIPFRKRQIAANRKSMFGVTAVLVFAMLTAGWIIRHRESIRTEGIRMKGFRMKGFRMEDIREDIGMRAAQDWVKASELARSDRNGLQDVATNDIRWGQVPRLGFPEHEKEQKNGESNPVRLLLWGDSYAKHSVSALDAFCREHGIVGDAIVADGAPPLIGEPLEGSYLGSRSTEWANAVLKYIEKENITHVLLVARWRAYEKERLGDSLRETVQHLDGMGCKVAILLAIPTLGGDAPRMLASEHLAGRVIPGWRQTIPGYREQNSNILKLAAAPDLLPARFLDPIPRMQMAGTDDLRVEVDGISLYYDNAHLTTRGANIILLPLFRDSLPAFLSGVSDTSTP